MSNNIARSAILETKKFVFSYFSALEKLFSDMPERPKNIIKERYGITGGKPKTLEEIGKEHKITRERVRQIIQEAIRKIKKSKTEFLAKIGENLEFTLKEKSGIMVKEELLFQLESQKEKGSLNFFLELLENVKEKDIAGELEESLMLSEFNFSEWKKIKNEIKAILEEKHSPLTENELFDNLKAKKITLERKMILDYLEASSEIKKNNFGKWGLKIWGEINPKGTREKIYLILKETNKPLHFKDIAKLIDENNLNKKKVTHPQTVHNELIRDKRFILVGRGIYALSEWGYEKGTVKDVLENILKKNNRPMNREEIIGKTLAVRKVKKSTVLINLNNFFQKVGKNEYAVKK